ncbi:hypothetical protein Rxyl_1883 [Rubrobacter xylanophilus DSM 9941]|uniref:Uncharacterized protein n=1 Tax=Rubrobacter xylanophilus (strain DSM 9941 / JCM 11954 / NBRC 16129 / PRD-1) TaxID=266117 RepID=Q1AUU5_RUBXD|nr:hypothetical protein Rxyl_1883 [Rubrobacter xylanophilus DSM 9941]
MASMCSRSAALGEVRVLGKVVFKQLPRLLVESETEKVRAAFKPWTSRSSPEVILLIYSLKSHDQLAGAREANRERRVTAVGIPRSASWCSVPR